MVQAKNKLSQAGFSLNKLIDVIRATPSAMSAQQARETLSDPVFGFDTSQRRTNGCADERGRSFFGSPQGAYREPTPDT